MSRVVDEPGGAITITPAALSQIVVRAAERVDGVRVRLPLPRRRVDVVLQDDRARVELALAVRYGEVLPERAREVQRAVADALSAMCAFEVDRIEITVEELER
jgi:uncharacterized alkaline shock family protein YloU